MEIDLSNLDQGTRLKMDEIFRSDFDLRVLKAVERQTRTAKARENGPRWQPDMKPEYEIDPVIDSLWRQYYGHNYTENADLMKFLMARNPEIKLRTRSGRIQTGYTGKTGCRFAPGTLRLAA